MIVSVVVPVRDEEATLAALLDSLRDQACPPHEIVIVDGGSRDRTVEIAASYAARDGSIRLVQTTGANPGEGRNIGAKAARGDVLVWTDAGVVLDRQWLGRLVEPLARDASVDVVYGSMEPIADSFFRQCAALAYVPSPVRRDGVWIRAPFIISSAMRRRVWEQVGGFRPFRASEDLIFMDAIDRAGFRIAYAPDAVAHWEIAGTWGGTFERFARYARHNLIAGRGRAWHLGVARLYAGALVIVGLAWFHDPWWTAVLVMAVAVRVGRLAYRKRNAFAFGDVFRPRRLAYVAALLVWLDAATVWGTLLWVWSDWLRPRLPCRKTEA
jgi:glycosyltransferase involved in cell wall biosynthesis